MILVFGFNHSKMSVPLKQSLGTCSENTYVVVSAIPFPRAREKCHHSISKENGPKTQNLNSKNIQAETPSP